MRKDGMISNKFRNLGFVAAGLVVFIHLGTIDQCVGSAWWFGQIVTNGISQMAVPFFFFASGYFLSRHLGDENWYESEVLKRIRSLLLPYLLWCAFYVAFSNGLQFLANLKAHRALFDNLFASDWVTWFGLDFGRPPFFTPMWFLRSLFLIVLATPLLAFCKKRLPTLVFLILAMIVEVYYFRGVFYFAAGMCFTGQKVGKHLCWACGAVALLGLVLKLYFQYTGLCWLPIAQQAWTICALVFSWGVIPSSEWPAFLTKNAFPLYLLHWPILCAYTIFVPNAIALGSASQMLIKGLVGIVLSIAAAVLLRKLSPRFAALCFGGR